MYMDIEQQESNKITGLLSNRKKSNIRHIKKASKISTTAVSSCRIFPMQHKIRVNFKENVVVSRQKRKESTSQSWWQTYVVAEQDAIK